MVDTSTKRDYCAVVRQSVITTVHDSNARQKVCAQGNQSNNSMYDHCCVLINCSTLKWYLENQKSSLGWPAHSLSRCLLVAHARNWLKNFGNRDGMPIQNRLHTA